ncbi:MAG TPA: ATP-binding cassette domain-containing protein [Gaiellaceae bacterium]|nr:ATP-binding cassette domain-containing protein [Gaiellaceae bacterium]
MLTLDRVSKTYRVGTFGGAQLAAVTDVSFRIDAGEIVSLIGESGSGKSTIGKLILRLATVTSGTVTFDGADVSSLSRGALRSYYGSVQGVFQDPFSSYNPIFKVGRVFDMVRDGLVQDAGADWPRRVDRALAEVGLDAAEVLHKYPHQLSGGQLQRLLVARALVLDIRLLVADEVISMLDASTRIDVLNLLAGLRAGGLGILFITHDLSLGHYISDRTVILRRGRIVETAATEKLFRDPRHAYTRMLLASVPKLGEKWGHGGFRVDAAAAERPDADEVLTEVDDGHFVAIAGTNGRKKA